MPMNEAMVANLTTEELAHYAAIDPTLVKQVDHGRFVEQLADEVSILQDDVNHLESEVRSYEEAQDETVCKSLYYVTWLEVKQATEEVATALYRYCEEQKLENDHPLKTILDDLEDVSRQVRDLY